MKLPEFKSEEEEAEFWDTRSLTDYLDELEEVTLEWSPEKDTCPGCGGQMNENFIDVQLNGLLIPHILQYQCPTCSTIKISEDALLRVNRIDTMIKQYGLAGMILQKMMVEQGIGK
ncbi:MAG: CopG family antitoxin [bacterium]|nr:CopG family antitoxin [bacterium]